MRWPQLLVLALALLSAPHALAVQPDEIMADPALEARARGLTILVCNRALMNTARSHAERVKANVEQVQAEFRAELVPGAIVMPNGIFSLVRAQNAGCAYLKF